MCNNDSHILVGLAHVASITTYHCTGVEGMESSPVLKCRMTGNLQFRELLI